MALVPAYDLKTGKKLPYYVPEHHIDHPVLGKNLSRTAPKPPTGKKADDGETPREGEVIPDAPHSR